VNLLGIIPARAGSKRLPGKNARMIAGRPLISWTIDTARQSGIFDDIIVSTDSEKIAEIASQSGCAPPFLRPSDLAQDDSSSADVVIHVLDWVQRQYGANPMAFMLLQPTSPLRTVEDMNEAWTLFQNKGAAKLVSITPSPKLGRLLTQMNSDGLLRSCFDPDQWGGSGYEQIYVQNGAIYIQNTQRFLEKPDFDVNGAIAYIMPEDRSVDIDVVLDLRLAECLLRERQQCTAE
jgi:CMP-N,N'-diacetyllegionaminic acid synthase